jgi:hypothetical protein
MALTSNDVANQAISLIGDNTPQVVGLAPNFSSGPAAQQLNQLYVPCVRTVARQFEWDFARSNTVLALSGNAAPYPWSFEYLYPAGTVELWQILPATTDDPNDPRPIDWNVGNTLVSSVQSRVIWTNQANAFAILNNMPDEATWDDLFREAVVRLLASELSIALFGKPDQAEAYLNSGAAMEQVGEARAD